MSSLFALPSQDDAQLLIELDDPEIVSLVNLRFMSQNLSLPPDEVLRARDQAGSYVVGYRDLQRSRP